MVDLGFEKLGLSLYLNTPSVSLGSLILKSGTWDLFSGETYRVLNSTLSDLTNDTTNILHSKFDAIILGNGKAYLDLALMYLEGETKRYMSVLLPFGTTFTSILNSVTKTWGDFIA
jgi:hypothetical protein